MYPNVPCTITNNVHQCTDYINVQCTYDYSVHVHQFAEILHKNTLHCLLCFYLVYHFDLYSADLFTLTTIIHVWKIFSERTCIVIMKISCLFWFGSVVPYVQNVELLYSYLIMPISFGFWLTEIGLLKLKNVGHCSYCGWSK